MLVKHEVDLTGTTVKNPQANGICEQMHRLVADILQVIMRTTKIENRAQTGQVMDNALVACQHTLCCAVNHTMQTSPGNLVFQQDMFIDVPVHADLIAICN